MCFVTYLAVEVVDLNIAFHVPPLPSPPESRNKEIFTGNNLSRRPPRSSSSSAQYYTSLLQTTATITLPLPVGRWAIYPQSVRPSVLRKVQQLRRPSIVGHRVNTECSTPELCNFPCFPNSRIGRRVLGKHALQNLSKCPPGKVSQRARPVWVTDSRSDRP